MRSFSAKEPNTAFGSTPIVALELSEPFFPFLAESGLIIFTRIFFAATTSFSTTFFSFSTTSFSFSTTSFSFSPSFSTTSFSPFSTFFSFSPSFSTTFSTTSFSFSPFSPFSPSPSWISTTGSSSETSKDGTSNSTISFSFS